MRMIWAGFPSRPVSSSLEATFSRFWSRNTGWFDPRHTWLSSVPKPVWRSRATQVPVFITAVITPTLTGIKPWHYRFSLRSPSHPEQERESPSNICCHISYLPLQWLCLNMASTPRFMTTTLKPLTASLILLVSHTRHQRTERLNVERLQWNPRVVNKYESQRFWQRRPPSLHSHRISNVISSKRACRRKKEGLGPGRTAFERGLALRAHDRLGSASFFSLKTIISSPAKKLSSSGVTGLGRRSYFWCSHLFWAPVIWARGKCQRGWNGWQCLRGLKPTRF